MLALHTSTISTTSHLHVANVGLTLLWSCCSFVHCVAHIQLDALLSLVRASLTGKTPPHKYGSDINCHDRTSSIVQRCDLDMLTTILLQLCDVVILTCLQQFLRENSSLVHNFLPTFVALSNLRRGSPTPTKHNLCKIQVCSVTHAPRDLHSRLRSLVSNVASHHHINSRSSL